MAPQPLSSLKVQDFILVTTAAKARKKHAAKAAECFAVASAIEAQFGAMLVSLLRAQATPALAMYGVMRNGSIQQDAVSAVLKVAVDQGLVEPIAGPVFVALLAKFRGPKKTRDRFAHWLWGVSKELPDHILLADPKAYHEVEYAVEIMFDEPSMGDDDTGVAWDRSRVFAYSVADIDETVDALREVLMNAHALRTGISLPPPSSGRQLRHLAKKLGISADQIHSIPRLNGSPRPPLSSGATSSQD